ncbi:MAG TPA: hypothetical protein VLK33_14710 [Terriglobales bacterium]|nr:hypothetical protein [Terriglobales bacterium]
MITNYRLICYSLKRSFDLVRQRRELVINDDDAVVPYGSTNVATVPFQHVHIACNLSHLHLYFAEIVVLSECGERKANKYNGEKQFPHEESPQKNLEVKIQIVDLRCFAADCQAALFFVIPTRSVATRRNPLFADSFGVTVHEKQIPSAKPALRNDNKIGCG